MCEIAHKTPPRPNSNQGWAVFIELGFPGRRSAAGRVEGARPGGSSKKTVK